MSRYEYMRIPVKHIPYDIIKQYNLRDLSLNDYILDEIQNNMYIYLNLI